MGHGPRTPQWKKRIFDAIEQNPGCTANELTQHIYVGGWSKGACVSEIAQIGCQLEDMGLVRVERHGKYRPNRYYPEARV